MAEQPFILVVDDEEQFREIFNAKLSSAGFRVDTAENGETAIGKMGSAKPDLVLMDVRMPGMDGPTTVLKMKDDANLRNIRVAFLTSLGDPREEIRDLNQKFAQDFGVQGYIRKTDNLDTILEEVIALVK